MDDAKPKNKGGRPSKKDVLSQHFAQRLVKNMLERGARDLEIAAELGISVDSLQRWKKANAEFCGLLKNWKDQAIEMVEKSLYLQAIGYSYKVPEYDKDGNVTGYKTELIKPNLGAAIFFLKNKKPSEWRDKPELDGEGQELPFDIIFRPREKKKPAPKDKEDILIENVGNGTPTN